MSVTRLPNALNAAVEAETLTGEDRVLAEEAAEWAGDEPAGFQEAFQARARSQTHR